MHVRTWLGVVLALTLTPRGTEAQKAWDLTGVVGIFTTHTDGSDERGYGVDDWSGAVQGAVTVGRYLSPHVKLELEASATGRDEQYGAIPIVLAGVPYPPLVFTEVRTSVRSLGGAVLWQFRDNEWVHPFVHAGLSADWDDAIVHVPQQFYHGDPRGTAIPLSTDYTERRTTTHLRGVVGGGAKLYFTEHAFVRTDGRLSLGADRQSLAFRAGLGIDF